MCVGLVNPRHDLQYMSSILAAPSCFIDCLCLPLFSALKRPPLVFDMANKPGAGSAAYGLTDGGAYSGSYHMNARATHGSNYPPSYYSTSNIVILAGAIIP